MRKLPGAAFLFLIPILMTSVASAAGPVLFFSDIASGPRSGNTDTSLGQECGLDGAIVTVWGKNLGGTQGSSSLYCNDAAARVYSWSDALAPADLFISHGMQMVSFQVSRLATEGPGMIYAVVDGKRSNELEFTVRDGGIYFVKTTGNDTAAGTWQDPWQTLRKAANGTTLTPGDIVYACDGVVEQGPHALAVRGPAGTENSPISLIAYPGATVKCVTTDDGGGITNWYRTADCWNFSKFTIETLGIGIYPFRKGRFVGCNISGPDASGSNGAISGGGVQAEGLKCYGNYIHDFGSTATVKLHHVFYITNRSGVKLEPFELAWNHLRDNKAYHALHVFDEDPGGDWNGTLRIHDNVVINQRGTAFDIVTDGTVDPCFSMDVEVYNNLFINCGLGPVFSPNALWPSAIYIHGRNNRSRIRIYNNTIYGYSDDTVHPWFPRAAILVNPQFGGTYELRNNIIVDTKDLPFIHPEFDIPPAACSNNLWYNGGDGDPGGPPVWDASALRSDPRLAAPPLDCTLAEGSPCIDAGCDTTQIVQRSLYGTVRTARGVDIGACEREEQTFTLSGRVVDIHLRGIPGVALRLTGDMTGQRTTDADGEFAFCECVEGCSILLSPLKPGYRFDPTLRGADLVRADLSGFLFTGVPESGSGTGAQGVMIVIGSAGGRGTVNPDRSERAMIYFRGTEIGTFTCRVFTMTGELVWEGAKSGLAEGTFEWEPRNAASGTYVVHVNGPGLDQHRKATVLR